MRGRAKSRLARRSIMTSGYRTGWTRWLILAVAVALLCPLALAERTAKAPKPVPESVEMFAAIEAGQIGVKLIPKDSTECRVLIENKTKKPLSKKKLNTKGHRKKRGGGKKRRSLKKGKQGKRYTAKQQTQLLDKYHKLRKGGMSADKAAKKVGVSYLTLLKWEKKSGKRIKTKRGRPKDKKGISKKAALKKALRVPKSKKRSSRSL